MVVHWGTCRVCGIEARLSDLQWSHELRSEACDECRDKAQRKPRTRGPVSPKWLRRGVDDHDRAYDLSKEEPDE